MTSTLAMHVRHVLSANGIRSEVIRLPSGVSASGCAFGVEISLADLSRAKKVLAVSDVNYGKIVITDK